MKQGSSGLSCNFVLCNFVLLGDIVWSKSPGILETAENRFLVCREGKSAGVYSRLPDEYASFPVKDYSGCLIIPGLTDLHVHAPQFSFRAIGMDMELLDWLNTHTFPEEAKYADPEYAKTAYTAFIEHVQKGPNTRLCVFATVHNAASLLLMDMLEESGLVCFAGKVNMDRNCPDYLREKSAAASLRKTREWLETFFERKKRGIYKNVLPILTPRFVPSCSGELLEGLGQLRKELSLPLQSHLSENKKEIAWVRQLCPESGSYAGAYDSFGLLGGSAPVVMAHCVWPEEPEIALLSERKVYVAHCPASNTNLLSGIAPVRRLLEQGVPLGLGSDIAGGTETSIFHAMKNAIEVSKLRQVLIAPDEKALTLEEAFWLGTAGGGSFFGKAGSFEPGYEFDAVVVDDRTLSPPFNISLRDRLSRIVHLSDDRHIVGKYVRGVPLPAE
jgi:guanine deaminase